jgi:hypothetical protein
VDVQAPRGEIGARLVAVLLRRHDHAARRFRGRLLLASSVPGA